MLRSVAKVAKISLASLVGIGAIILAIVFYQGRRHPAGAPEYVALGSSFAAGLGLGIRAPNSPIVCLRSVNGYPQQLSRELGLALIDMTCSGSTADNILAGGQFFQGPQLASVRPATRLVTLTSGGNDISYIGDLFAMSYSNRSTWLRWMISLVYTVPHSPAERGLPALEKELRAILRDIRRQAPAARIVVATYPRVLPVHGTCQGLDLSAEQAALMRHVADQLAQATRMAARAESAILVDMAAISAGHDACSANPWTNGARPATGVAFHPTLAGTKATAKYIAEALEAAPRG